MSEKNIVTARIFGSEYTISGTESKEYILKVCDTVNEKMNLFAGATSLNPMRTAVLCSVNMCDEMFKCEEKLQYALNELKEIKEQLNSLNTKNRVLNEENNYLKNELRDTRNKYTGDRK